MLVDLHIPGGRGIHCGTILVNAIERLGVEYVFGIPGGSIEPFFNALAKSPVQHILCRHEGGGASMAEGYARATGKLGVCCATAGPGAANLVTGVAGAFASNTPLLVITAQTAINRFGYFALQDSTPEFVDTVSMLSACTRYSSVVSHADQILNKLSIALGTAFGSRPGPVHLSFPLDVLKAQPALDVNSGCRLPIGQQVYDLNPERVAALVDAITSARSGVFVVGPQAQAAVAEITALAETLQWPLVTTPMAKGLIASDHPLNAGVYGMAGHRSADEQMSAQCSDVIFALGFMADEVSTKGWQHNSVYSERTLVLSGHELSVFSFPRARMRLLCDVHRVFVRLNEALAPRYTNIAGSKTFTVRENKVNRLPPPNNAIHPHALLKKLNAILPAHSPAVFDAGNAFLWGIHYWQCKQPPPNVNLMHIETGFAAMGWAISAAIGLALANLGGRTVVCFSGDGSMLMSGNEISVAAEHNLNIIFVVLNDSELGMVKHGQHLSGAARIGTQLPAVDFAALAKIFGLYSVRLNTPEELSSLDIHRVLAQVPALIDVRIDPGVIPPLGDRLSILNASG